MEPHHETSFPATLCRWVGEIVQSSPEAGRLTLVELIVGAVLASGGHVTQAILALTPRLGWQAYHWMLEHGRFRLLGLISALCRIVRREIGARRCFAIIDGSLARIIHETRGRRSRIPEKQGLMGLVKSGARALFSRQGSVLASSIDRK